MAKCFQQVRGTTTAALWSGASVRSRVVNLNNALVLVVIILVLIAQSGVGLR